MRFLTIARESLSELDTQLRVAGNLDFVFDAKLLDEIENLQAGLGSLIKSQRERIKHELRSPLRD